MALFLGGLTKEGFYSAQVALSVSQQFSPGRIYIVQLYKYFKILLHLSLLTFCKKKGEKRKKTLELGVRGCRFQTGDFRQIW